MPAKLIDGKKVAQKVLDKAAKEVAKLKANGVIPGLAIVQMGDNPASNVYIGKKLEAAKGLGLHAVHKKLSVKASFEELSQTVSNLNSDSKTSGIIIQLPLSKHIDSTKALSLVNPEKDVDGFSPFNQGMLFAGKPVFVPATVKGIIKLIESTGTKIAGKNVVVIGRSLIVGRPCAAMLSGMDATVTLCHSKTKNLAEHTKRADILICAVGKPRLVKKNMAKKGCIVIDVGTTKVKGKLVGDVDFENVKKIAGAITPVPGGVGPMTVACLIENTIEAAKRLSDAKN